MNLKITVTIFAGINILPPNSKPTLFSLNILYSPLPGGSLVGTALPGSWRDTARLEEEEEPYWGPAAKDIPRRSAADATE